MAAGVGYAFFLPGPQTWTVNGAGIGYGVEEGDRMKLTCHGQELLLHRLGTRAEQVGEVEHLPRLSQAMEVRTILNVWSEDLYSSLFMKIISVKIRS